jgi:glycerophosphoryl diester phosphodiesterase
MGLESQMTAVTTLTKTLLAQAASDYRFAWQPLALTDIAFKIIAFIILTPITGLLFRGLLAISGAATLADMDILFFFLGPYGWFSLILLGAIWLAIVALEQAALTSIVYAKDRKQHLRPTAALKVAARKAWPVIQVTTRMVAITLLLVAPFLAVAGATYLTLLTEYDINYYLREKPPVFIASLALGALLGISLTALLLRFFTSWFFALPLVLFEDVQPRDALRLSTRRVQGHRLEVLLWIVGWFLATTLISAGMTAVVALIGRWIVPGPTGSLQVLALTVGVFLLLWTLTGLAVNLFSTTTFAVMLFRLYRQLGCDDDRDQAPLALQEAASSRSELRVTRTRLLAGGAIGILIAIAVGIYAVRSVRVEDNVQIMAHRGSSKKAPENTMASIRQAIEDGADWVEIDVQETADGEVVVFHDSDFMKVAGRDLKIWDATMADLRDIDIGSYFSDEFREERVPTLADVLQECHDKIGVNIELKYYGHDVQLEQRVADIVHAHNMDGQVKAMSLKSEGVKKMKSIRPDWQVGLLMSVATGKVKDIEADFLAVNASFADRKLIRSAHVAEKEVYVWTVNDSPTMSAMISRGVDGLLTDKPALARYVLEQRAEMSSPERLLLEIGGLLGAKPELGEP